MNFNLQHYQHILIIILRWAIGIVFIWFGVLKVFGYNPVYDLIYFSAAPFFASGMGLVVLGAFETIVGLLIIANRLVVLTHILLLLHLLGTFTTFIFGYHIVFDPHFPVLSLEGEFVIKNMIIAIAGLVVLTRELSLSKETK